MKKHSAEEILAKLGQADELARRGQSQVQICKALGVSVMTFHRWRKLPLRQFDSRPVREEKPAHRTSDPLTPLAGNQSTRKRLEELKLENQQLRKIVTDLLLEKLRIEEAAAKYSAAKQSAG